MTKEKIKNIIKKIRPSRIMFLIILVLANTFAWFIYATKIDSNIQVHVKAWNVIFEAGENQVTDTVNINVESIFPGMDDYEYSISAYNRSEVSASLSYQILEANILGTSYITEEGRAERGEEANETDLSSIELEEKLYNDYPFQISLNVSNTTIAMGTGRENYTLGVVWPYENNNDAIDTEWGIAAYNYKRSNPDKSSITLRIKIIITQNVN